MTRVIVLGHGGYGTAVKMNLGMLLGELEGFSYIDFNPGDDLDILNERLASVIQGIEHEPILFACDLTGGSPFRQACLLAAEHPNMVVVAGINTSGYADIAYALDLSPLALAEQAIASSKEAMQVFHL
jgi:PTS system N-acetylgalactosamine-specific IIA component